jgi:RsiW-degrading membrane proteinase PrsW (M82 family)
LLSFFVVPTVYMAQIVFLAFATNLPAGLILGFTLVASALFEEIVKAIGILVLAEHGVVKSTRNIIGLSFLSALGFLVGEKLLVFLSLNIVSDAPVSGALFGAGLLLFIPLIAHFVFTAIITWLSIKLKFPYVLALGIGTTVHVIYNVYVLRGGF